MKTPKLRKPPYLLLYFDALDVAVVEPIDWVPDDSEIAIVGPELAVFVVFAGVIVIVDVPALTDQTQVEPRSGVVMMPPPVVVGLNVPVEEGTLDR